MKATLEASFLALPKVLSTVHDLNLISWLHHLHYEVSTDFLRIRQSPQAFIQSFLMRKVLR